MRPNLYVVVELYSRKEVMEKSENYFVNRLGINAIIKGIDIRLSIYCVYIRIIYAKHVHVLIMQLCKSRGVWFGLAEYACKSSY